MEFSKDTIHVDGFGEFDVGITDGLGGPSPNAIAPGATGTFVLDIYGSTPFLDTDFTTELSVQVDGHILSLAAAKFQGDPISAHGNVVPEPASLMVLLAGGLGVMLRKRR